jgi:hypothetical protein
MSSWSEGLFNFQGDCGRMPVPEPVAARAVTVFRVEVDLKKRRTYRPNPCIVNGTSEGLDFSPKRLDLLDENLLDMEE